MVNCRTKREYVRVNRYFITYASNRVTVAERSERRLHKRKVAGSISRLGKIIFFDISKERQVAKSPCLVE